MNRDKISIVLFASQLHDNSSVLESRKEIFSFLNENFNVNIVTDLNEIPREGIKISFIATGGTEESFRKSYSKLSFPLIFLSDGIHNSLAASLEISTFLTNKNIKHKHINIPSILSSETKAELVKQISDSAKILNAFDKLRNFRIALMGNESPWLISSEIDKELVYNKYGVKFIEVPLSEVEERYLFLLNTFNSSGKTSFNDELSSKYIDKLEDRSNDELNKALIFNEAIGSIARNYNAGALTIKCFDLLSSCKTTACLSLAMLNDEGVVAGCEGDIPALWSMLVANLLTDKAVFMANPSSIDTLNNTIDFSHCTVPLCMTNEYKLPSHFESQSGIGVRGIMPLEEYTLIKIAGNRLDRFFCAEGKIIENTSYVQRCRTQIKFKFNDQNQICKFTEAAVGNHVVLVPGRYKSLLELFMKLS